MEDSVQKRYFRLAIPCGVALVYAYLLGGWTWHEAAADVTKSWWLLSFNCRRPSPIAGLLQQIVVGVWHGTCTLNNAIWTMQFELFGSYLVYILVFLLKDLSGFIRKRFLFGVFVALLIPSATQSSGLMIRLDWKEGNELVRASLNPFSHAHLLQEMDVSMSMIEHAPDPWWGGDYVDSEDPPVTPLDARMLESLLNQPTQFTLQRLELARTWTTSSPWLWYAAFVSGVLISEVGHNHPAVTASPRGKGLVVALILVSFISASYPSFVSPNVHPVW
eukprot:CAMPEP_0185795248 /NCGR_PEP_ID=MMETSP1174-20130828/160449_1 /TAXON_ID=35687 /ORGANISM="Dictyocha speculum, Strain CCMP1381" /LENGTH=275 /DNA_ID=CAMNT_0028490535 /DNA_START=82 /DNA_END=907 /DNA_ORIENTATION=-